MSAAPGMLPRVKHYLAGNTAADGRVVPVHAGVDTRAPPGVGRVPVVGHLRINLRVSAWSKAPLSGLYPSTSAPQALRILQ